MDVNDSLYDYDENLDYEEEFTHEHVIKSAFHVFCIVCYILIVCISVPGNILLWRVLWRERAQKTTHDILLLQLIYSDLLLTAALAFQFLSTLSGSIHVVRVMFFFWGLNSYVLILSDMVVNHYVSVVHASHLSVQSPKVLIMASCVLWMACTATSIKVLVSAAMDYEFGMHSWGVIFLHTSHLFTEFDVYVQLFGFFLIPLVIILFCCVSIFITTIICRMNRDHQDSRLIFGMIAVFFLSFVPYNILLFIKTVPLGIQIEWTQTLRYIDLITDTLPYLPCCLNPLLHLIGVQRFRRHLTITCKTSGQRRDGRHNIDLTAVPSRDPDDV